jgi:O-glycosyl hydrolase
MASKGAPIYAVSIANEPNYAGGYDGCEWTPAEMRDFFKEVGRYTQGVRGFGGGKATPTVLTVNGESANNPNINHAAMDDPVSSAAIDLFARHVYGDQIERLWGHANLNNREVWMTEHNINSANDAGYPMDSTWNYLWRFMNDVDLVIRLNNENAFVWWVVKRFYSFIGEGAASTVDHAILPRGWGLAHYSKFTIDTNRIPVTVTGNINNSSGASTPVAFNSTDPDIAKTADTSNINNAKFDLDNTSVRITAFISQDGSELSLVMFTPTMIGGDGGYGLGTAEIKMPEGFLIRSVSAMLSKAGAGGGSSRSVENMGKWVDDVEVASDRKSAFVTLDRSQMLSVKFIKE